MLVVAPPRQGKDVHFCVPNIIDAPGPCIATTTRSDMFINTVSSREKVGKVWVFDPNGLTNWPSQLRWSPVNGCQDPLVALNRASAFVSSAGVGEGVQNASYWTGVSIAILRCYLLAAALAGKTITDVARWSTQPLNPEPIEILRRMEALGKAPQGWAGELEGSAASSEESRGSMWAGVRRSLDCFADPMVMRSCSPRPDEEFNVADFVAGRNTLYVLGKEKKNGSVAPLVTAMMEDIFDQVRKIAGRMPNSRIDPPLTVELNEAAHIAPMPNLPGYMGDSGGFSISLHVYLQSLGQARNKWGNDEAAVMWDTAAIRVVMGGSGYVNDLDEISRLLGEVDEKQKSVSQGAGGRSVSYSKQKRRVMSVDELRTLEFGTALVIARAARPVEIKLTPYFKRKDAKEIAAGQARVGKLLAELEHKQMANAAAGIIRPGVAPQRDLWAEQAGQQPGQQPGAGMPVPVASAGGALPSAVSAVSAIPGLAMPAMPAAGSGQAGPSYDPNSPYDPNNPSYQDAGWAAAAAQQSAGQFAVPPPTSSGWGPPPGAPVPPQDLLPQDPSGYYPADVPPMVHNVHNGQQYYGQQPPPQDGAGQYGGQYGQQPGAQPVESPSTAQPAAPQVAPGWGVPRPKADDDDDA